MRASQERPVDDIDPHLDRDSGEHRDRSPLSEAGDRHIGDGVDGLRIGIARGHYLDGAPEARVLRQDLLRYRQRRLVERGGRDVGDCQFVNVPVAIGIVTALNPFIGYDNATQVAKEALESGRRDVGQDACGDADDRNEPASDNSDNCCEHSKRNQV